MVFFLAAITLGLFSRVLGADDAPLGAVMGKRGEAGAAVGTATPGVGSSSANGVTTAAASASETPNRSCRKITFPNLDCCCILLSESTPCFARECMAS